MSLERLFTAICTLDVAGVQNACMAGADFNDTELSGTQNALALVISCSRYPRPADKRTKAEIDSARLEIIDFLISVGADEVFNKIYPHSVLFSAVAEKRLEIVRLLLDRGANANFGGHGRSAYQPIFYASLDESTEIVALLCERGADVNAFSWSAALAWAGSSPLLEIVGSVDPENAAQHKVASILCRHGANIMATNGNGEMLLDLAKWKPRLCMLLHAWSVLIVICSAACIFRVGKKSALRRLPRELMVVLGTNLK